MCIYGRRKQQSRGFCHWRSCGPFAMVAALVLGLSDGLRHPVHAAETGAAFLAQMAREPGVTTLPSGLEYKVLKSGDPNGAHPSPGDELVLDYDGTLPDGATFDSTDQQGGMARLPFQGLIPGWMQALTLMRPGDEWMLYIPARLGYGAKGAGPIPPNSPLVFRIDLVAVHHDG